MLPENHDDATFKEFPSLERPFDTYDAPALGVASEALRTFRKIVGYDLNFVRPGAKPAATETAVDDDDVSPLERVESFPVGELGVRVYGTLKLSRSPGDYPRVDWSDARRLATLVAGLLAANCRWRDALASREGELAALATDVPNKKRSRAQISSRLRDVLRSGARALGDFSAAALYLLDDATTTLKTRAVWGLPDDRYLDPPRPLRGARAEVEALLGSAVTLNDDYLAEEWKAPESFPCSVCVPVASDTTTLGVAWFFSERRRELGTRELETLDLIVCRLVDELEKESASIPRKPRRDETTSQKPAENDERQEWINSILKTDE